MWAGHVFMRFPPILHLKYLESCKHHTQSKKPVSSSLYVQQKKIYPFANKTSSKVFEKGLALRLVVMKAVQITAESGLVEDLRHYHFSLPLAVNSLRYVMWIHQCVWCPFRAQEGLWSAARLSMPTDVTLVYVWPRSFRQVTGGQPNISHILSYSCVLPCTISIRKTTQLNALWETWPNQFSVIAYYFILHFFFLSNLVEGLLFHRTKNWNTCFW